jgi:ATP-dependent RNA helicase HelY
VVDVLDQVAKAAPDATVRETARKAVGAVRRGVVAYAGT